ncbi:response regulator transcription factor [Shouchella clausii]|uniref:Two-component response regulator n=3 Tax=Shouchella TaxID=2893057 RepID=Q5WCK3_SHOC1|nr:MULTISPECIES: response regulator transcription factor [Shouchella]MCM3312891.1 response regulator transcription factor [Psychrobacillus sp. MER TA 17]ALA53731.1 Two component transcriptional regulator VraR [Shouchella clausii]KKI87429.1 LuxR family transcriptional regulator [Shouchella clausii]MBU3229702.1 response regulator transcription factor [Shouchella clausii]MBU3264214.1 response regulator transcription factor [Shouchella clausii]
MIQVLIVDDHETVRMGVSAFLSTQEDLHVAGEAANGEEGVKLALQLKPDVILMDLVMDGMDGIEATKQIKANWPQAKIVVVTSFVDSDKLRPVLEAGATSYVLKTSSAMQIAEAIRKTYNGESVLDAKVQGQMISAFTANVPLHQALTKRELEILKLMSEGKTNQQISEELYITIKTVKTHVSHILAKLEVEDRTQAVIYALKEKLFGS